MSKTLQITIESSQLQRDHKLRAGADGFPSIKLPKYEKILADEQRVNEGLSHKKLPDDEKIISEEPRGDVRILSQQLPDHEDRPSKKYEGIERVRPQYKVLYSRIYLFQETEEILLINERK